MTGAPRGPRQRDTTNAEARLAVQGAVAQVGQWRNDLARFSARTARPCTPDDRRTILKRCARIEAELADVRAALLRDLEAAPQRVAGHSRVVDIERALDGIAGQTRALRQQLG